MIAANAGFNLFMAETEVPDPGNAGTIAIDKSLSVVNLVSTGAETRTMADPTKQGAITTLYMYTDGGDITVTFTTAFTEDGATTFVFSDVGQFLALQSFRVSATAFAWRKISDHALANLAPADSDIIAAFSALTASVAELNRAATLSTRVIAHGSSDPASLALTAALHDGKTLYVTKTDGLAITLPVPVAGMRFRIIIGATIASASSIKSVAGTHLMIGHATLGNDSNNSTVDWQATAASTYDTIDLLGTGNSTGGMEGQEITIEAMSTTRWFVRIQGDAAGTEATPFSDTVA